MSYVSEVIIKQKSLGKKENDLLTYWPKSQYLVELTKTSGMGQNLELDEIEG